MSERDATPSGCVAYGRGQAGDKHTCVPPSEPEALPEVRIAYTPQERLEEMDIAARGERERIIRIIEGGEPRTVQSRDAGTCHTDTAFEDWRDDLIAEIRGSQHE